MKKTKATVLTLAALVGAFTLYHQIPKVNEKDSFPGIAVFDAQRHVEVNLEPIIKEADYTDIDKREKIASPTDDVAKYKVPATDKELWTKVVPGIAAYLGPMSRVKYNNTELVLPVHPNLMTNNLNFVVLNIKDGREIWDMQVDGKWDISYLSSGASQSDGYLLALQPRIEDSLEALIQGKDMKRIAEMASLSAKERYSWPNADGLLAYAFDAIPKGDRQYFGMSVKPRTFQIYDFNIFSGEVVEKSPNYRANNRINPGCELMIQGLNQTQALLYSFTLRLSEQQRGQETIPKK